MRAIDDRRSDRTARVGSPETHLSIRVLGPLAVTAADGSPISMTARKHAELLTILTTERSSVSAERVADLLWRGAPPPSAASTLQGYISRLRKLLGPTGRVRIDTVAAGYVLRCDGAATDLDLVDRLGQEGLEQVRTDPAAGAQLLCRALDLWRGDPLPEIADITDLAPELVRLDEMRSDLTETAADALRAVGEQRRAIGLLTPHCHRNPYREGAARSLARALHSDGRTADALSVLRRLRQALSDELGLDPGPATAALESELLGSVPQVPSGGTPKPFGRTLFGRSGEIAMLERVWATGVDRPAGAVLVGPAGVGKTTLIEDFASRHEVPPRRFIGRPGRTGAPFDALAQMFGDGPRTVKTPAITIGDVTSRIWSDISEYGRAVLILDDLDWLDADSAQMLAGSVAITSGPVTVFATCRSAGAEAVSVIRAALNRHSPVAEIGVPGLTSDDIREVIADRLRAIGAPPSVDAASIAEQSLGNPLLAVTLCDAARLGRSLDTTSVPALIRAQVDSLTRGARDALDLLATAGGGLPADVLDQAIGPPSATTAVDELRATGTAERADDAVLLVHRVVQDVVLADLSRTDRLAIHARLADAFATVRPRDLESRAVHLSSSAVDEPTSRRAADGCLAAASEALDDSADHRALELARRGLSVTHQDDTIAVGLHRVAGTAATRIGDFDSATESFDAAARISRGHADWQELAETALLSAPHGVAGYWSGFGVVFSAHVRLVREALSHSDTVRPPTVARLHAGEAARLTVLGAPGADDHLGAARIAAGGGLEDYEIALADFLVRWEPSLVDERRTIAGELVDRWAGDIDRQATALHLQRVCALEAGDLRMARRTSAEFARLVARRPGGDLDTMQVWWQVMLALLRGDYETSASLTDRFATTVGALSDRARLLAEASVATSRSIEAWHRGELASMLPTFDTLVDEIDDDFALVIALGAAEAGDHERALRMATELTADADGWTGSRVVARVPLLVETLHAVSLNPDTAASAAEICSRIEHLVASWSAGLIVQWPGLVCLGPAVLYRGTARQILGDDGAGDLRAAVRLARDVGALPYQRRAERRLAAITSSGTESTPSGGTPRRGS